MSIQAGERVPTATLTIMTESGPTPLTTEALFEGSRVVLFSVPGAFTPTCSAKHLPGFIQREAELRARGIDKVACMAVNDVFVMQAWGKSAGAGDILMLADGNGEFTRALGLELDATAWGMGMRSQRFALVAEDGIVTRVFVEAPGEFRISSAENVLAHL